MDEYKIGGLNKIEWNKLMNEYAHRRIPASCPRCFKRNEDYKAIKIGSKGIYLGGCKKCSDEDFKWIRNFMMGIGELEPI